MHWYLKVLKNYVGFQGRASRKEYWMFVLFNLIFGIIFSILDELLKVSPLLSIIYGFAVLLPSLAVGVRRLHDTGKNGWWILIGLIPVIGDIVLLVFYCQDSQVGHNKYGSNPKFNK